MSYKKIYLKDRYRSRLEGDFSKAYIRGVAVYKNKEEKNKIINIFYTEKKIKLRERLSRYKKNDYSHKEITVKFPEDDYIQSSEGFRTKRGENLEEWQHYYWLENG